MLGNKNANINVKKQNCSLYTLNDNMTHLKLQKSQKMILSTAHSHLGDEVNGVGSIPVWSHWSGGMCRVGR